MAAPHYITNGEGKKISVVLPLKNYQKLLDAAEELHDIHLYDKVKKNDEGKRILFTDYLKKRKKTNA